MLIDIDLIFGMLVSHHDLQIEYEFRYAPLIFGEIIGFGLSKFQRSISAIKQFSGIFSQTLADYDLIFGMLVNHHELQIEFEFSYAPFIFGEIGGFGLSKFLRSYGFPDFFPKRL